VPKDEGPPLTEATVERVRREIREHGAAVQRSLGQELIDGTAAMLGVEIATPDGDGV
jgi:hypothetical protein